MSKSLYSKLKKFLKEGGSEGKVEECENSIIDEIEKHIKDDYFYSLPTEEILKIISKSNIEDVELLCELIYRMSEIKGEDAVLLLNYIKREESLDVYIKILSNSNIPGTNQLYTFSLRHLPVLL